MTFFTKLSLLLTISLLQPIATYGDEEFPALEAQVIQPEPAIRTRFYSAESVEAIPKLKYLNEKNPGFNKILIKVEGFPKHQEIIFEIKRPLGANPDQFQPVASFEIDDDGMYITKDKQRLPFIVGSSKGFLPGERITLRARTADSSVAKESSGIPSPAIVKDEQGNVTLRAEILSLEPTVYAIDLPKMSEGEEYELISNSLGQTVKSKPKYDSKAPLHYSPVSKTKSGGGKAQLTIKRKSGETYAITLPWGSGLEIYQQGAKNFPYHN